MKNNQFVFIYLLLFFTLSNCSPKEYPLGNFQETPILADGNSVDWHLPLRFGSEDGALQYNITNDNNNIYVSVATSDPSTQMRMLRTGISVYVDTKGKTNKTMGLSFPANEVSKMERINNRERNSSTNKTVDQTNFKKQLLMDNDIFKTFGFINMDNRIYDVSDTSAIKIGMNNDAFGNLVFESIIPIKFVYNKPFNAKNATSLSVGIVLNSMNNNDNRNANTAGGEGGMRGGGMGGGMRGGGMGGGGMGGGGMGGGMRGGGGRRGSGGGMRGGGGGFDNNKVLANWYQFKLVLQ